MLITRDEYFGAMTSMFDDESVYRKLTSDPTARIECQCKENQRNDKATRDYRTNS